jgi:hypothetical protein
MNFLFLHDFSLSCSLMIMGPRPRLSVYPSIPSLSLLHPSLIGTEYDAVYRETLALCTWLNR